MSNAAFSCKYAIAKLKDARFYIRVASHSFSGSSLEYVRCFNLVRELDNLLESLESHEL